MIIGGHPRSGTTLLTKVCNTHPEISSTHEFKSFLGIGKVKKQYLSHLPPISRPWPIIGWHDHRVANYTQSWSFQARFTRAIRSLDHEKILLDDVLSLYQRLLPGKKVYGDKFPYYGFIIDRYVEYPQLKLIVIYRDPRDVVASMLHMNATKWKGKEFVSKHDTPEKISAHWVEAIEMIEKYRDSIHVIRYETLINDPTPVLTALGDYLGVAPEGFQFEAIHDKSIGRYKTRLSREQIDEVEAVAGEKMASFGYR